MVQTDLSQLSAECNSWRNALRSNRDEINQYKLHLLNVVTKQLSKNQLQDVEHYHNQFHIQLINVHDLKQEVKVHERRVHFELFANNSQLSESTLSMHEELYYRYQFLDETLHSLHTSFFNFLSVSN
ncbi:MAG: hypothetical protein EPO57_07770 [Chitinophagaceae bacterium]|nr:MAG: hypothetical protein EPO57_07770 [Chitinophagaceae bacterium]